MSIAICLAQSHFLDLFVLLVLDLTLLLFLFRHPIRLGGDFNSVHSVGSRQGVELFRQVGVGCSELLVFLGECLVD